MIDPHNELPVGHKHNVPRDVFLHLLAMVALYWSAISVITLGWQYVNYFFPQALDYSYGLSGNVRFAVSSLIIMFPVFLVTSWFLNKIYRAESVVRESKIRKWLIYLTLFIAALVIIGDLIFLVNTFLGGEITIRFVLKSLLILAVAGKIFWYYLDDVRRSAPHPKVKMIAWATAIFVAAIVVGAFFIVGSPKTARQLQLDVQRINDLQSIQSQIVYYWQRKGIMPANLQELQDPLSTFLLPTDPVTGASYEYKITGASVTAFELCATFDLSNANKPVPDYYGVGQNWNWNHDAGYTCFERAIDSQLYPPIK